MNVVKSIVILVFQEGVPQPRSSCATVLHAAFSSPPIVLVSQFQWNTGMVCRYGCRGRGHLRAEPTENSEYQDRNPELDSVCNGELERAEQ